MIMLVIITKSALEMLALLEGCIHLTYSTQNFETPHWVFLASQVLSRDVGQGHCVDAGFGRHHFTGI
jgi:hypothetical protein